MIVLGLHLGHDATACVLADGEILSFIEKERVVRLKHAGFVDIDLIDIALERAGVELDQIDYVSITQTQNWPLVFFDTSKFFFDVDIARAAELKITDGAVIQVLGNYKNRRARLKKATTDRFTRAFVEGSKTSAYAAALNEEIDFESDKLDVAFSAEFPIWPKKLATRTPTKQLFRHANREFREYVPQNPDRVRFHIPLTVTIRGREFPGAQFPHHLAHAAVAHYQSGKENTAVLTVDNGHNNSKYGYTGGLYCLGAGTQLGVLGPNFAHHGHVYNRMGLRIGWDAFSAAGKLMGLAPYGKPVFYDPTMIGSYADVFDFPDDTVYNGWETTADWVEYIAAHAKDRGYAPLTRDPSNVLAPLSVDIAASTQRFFEEQTQHFATTLEVLCQRIGFEPEVLGLSGGCALNCPANSLLHRAGRFPELFVPPSVDDSGLALGGAFLLMHDLFDVPRVTQDPYSSNSAYLGRDWTDAQVRAAIEAQKIDLEVEERSDTPDAAAADLIEDHVIAWFEGKSEVGPRALGNRSILANPGKKANWARTNDIKRREHWRPFAPAVLEEKNDDWFEGAPSISPFMLFTAQVKGDKLPAITHVDGSARVQTVAKNCGGFRTLLERLDERTGVPVVLNTSFNGPGEPIVDTPTEAINFLKSSDIDALYLQGYKLKRRQ